MCPGSAVLLMLTGRAGGIRAGSCPGQGARQRDGVSLLPSVALSLQATETGEPRGSDSSGWRGPLRRGGQAPRPGASELGEHLMGAGLCRGGAFLTLWADLIVSALSPDLSTAPPGSPPEAALVYQDLPVRIFVALFDYDPVSMSPNPDAGEEELPFREGQILKVTNLLSGSSLRPPFLHWRYRGLAQLRTQLLEPDDVGLCSDRHF